MLFWSKFFSTQIFSPEILVNSLELSKTYSKESYDTGTYGANSRNERMLLSSNFCWDNLATKNISTWELGEFLLAPKLI